MSKDEMLPYKLQDKVRRLYDEFGQRKPMGAAASNARTPHYFLHRTFLGENDLLIIYNTRRCRYLCSFCDLPQKSSEELVSAQDILAQFELVIEQLRHSLSVLDRVTFSNEGSVLDAETFPRSALLTLASCVGEMRRVRSLVLETRIEFVDLDLLSQIKESATRVTVDILTGFETQDVGIRNRILCKGQPMDVFLDGMDRVGQSGSRLTCFVLYKPHPAMSDDDAFAEADKSIDFLRYECQQRKIPLTIRLNPMYMAKNSRWAELAKSSSSYKPPRLTDVMRLAENKTKEGVPVYIGLSSEGLDDLSGSYMCREDYSQSLIRQVKLFNDKGISQFDWESLRKK